MASSWESTSAPNWFHESSSSILTSISFLSPTGGEAEKNDQKAGLCIAGEGAPFVLLAISLGAVAVEPGSSMDSKAGRRWILSPHAGDGIFPFPPKRDTENLATNSRLLKYDMIENKLINK